jgi:DNA-directed RNA polymerase beta' subunit
MARSFITCDPSLRLDEIGIPKDIAQGVQKPVVVRKGYNYDKCMIYFNNAASGTYPKASRICKNGVMYLLPREQLTLEDGDVIYCDITDGDVVNFNRQPSLEPSSMASHKVVIMEQGKTIRMNVLICSLYNADFDGDAMNVLFTRSSRTTNEIQQLSSPAQRFISYKNARPKIGEAQDSLVGVAELTRTGAEFDKLHAMRIFSHTKVVHDFSQYPSDKIFTGRELVSIYLKETNNEINYTGRPAIYNPIHARYRPYNDDDVNVVIDRGELKSGILDKNSIGEGAQGGIFHIIHNQYGPDAALEASFSLQQMSIAYMFNRGVTVSMADIMLKDSTLGEIHKIEKKLIAESLNITSRLNSGSIIPPLGKTITEYYEDLQINALDPGDEYWPYILSDIDPEHNNLYKLIAYGSKGKLFNFKNVSSAIGQIEINGERIKENFGGRTAPYFTRHDPRPSSRGYIANGYRTGITPTEFIFHAEENRYQLINKALSTSITGMQNRMSIKNLEALIVDNQRKLTKSPGLVQPIYGGDGVDPRFLEKVKFPTMDKSFTNAKFKELFHSNTKSFDKKFQNANVQKKLDGEYAQLVEDRDFFREVIIKIERASGQVFSDSISMPVNIKRILEDVIFNLGLKDTKDKGTLNPVATVEKVSDLCETITYSLLNEIQEQRRSKIPPHMRDATAMLRVLIRSYLNTSALKRLGITDDALDLVIQNVKLTHKRSLVSYGMAMGIIAAQSISEPMTQMVLDSHHHSGAASTKKKGMFRIQEITGAKPTERMKAPSMTLQVKEEYESDKIKVQEIAHHIEMMRFRDFVTSSKIFFEEYGNPTHPKYKDERKIIGEFEKYNLGVSAPTDLANWCIRFSLDKYKLIEKQMKMETIYFELRKKYPDVHIVYSSDNADNIIMRVYMRNVMFGKSFITTNMVRDKANELQDTVIRGVSGVRAAFVKDGSKTVVSDDGSVVEKKIYYIFTDGTNLEAVLENPDIDPYTAQSDSVIEMCNIFGIGSSREKIIYEFRDQVGEPSYRHFTIYADEMTHGGRVTSIDRYGTAKRDASIMLRISDASPISVIEDSAINSATDNLKGVSPPLMVGKNPRVGDLYNAMIWDEKFIEENIKSDASIIEDELA